MDGMVRYVREMGRLSLASQRTSGCGGRAHVLPCGNVDCGDKRGAHGRRETTLGCKCP